MRIRRADGADAAAATDVARAAKASWNYPAEWLEEWDHQLQLTASYIRTHAVFVAESGGRIIGVVSVEACPEGPEIGHLWVLPEAQGRGVGRALLLQAREVGTENGWDSLRVVADPFAEPFYERMGAVRVDTVDAPVRGTERRLPVMSLPVK